MFHPGAINTDLQRHVNDTWYGKLTMPFFKLFFKTPLQGAQTTIYCCVEDSIEKDSGKYYSDCKEKTPARAARSDEDAKRLWEISEKMVGLSTE